ncbi:MAG: hypothetical protein GX921_04835, partial [Bacteroidales bacterium]|nr:hypothetical protein [Bacteroidales bacterium]
MEKELFYAYLKGENQLSDESLPQLKQIAEKYPYFQTAKLMLLKNMQVTKDSAFTSELKKVAITCCDRRKLFYYLNDDRYARFFLKKVVEEEPDHDRTEILLDTFLETLDKSEETEETVAPISRNEWEGDSIISTDYLAYLEKTEQEESLSVDEKDTKPMKHQGLVDKFLEESSKDENLFSNKNREIKETHETAQSVDNLLDDDSFLTQTLAQVYIKQKKYEQALTIIKRLSLNFPEKSIYFAD